MTAPKPDIEQPKGYTFKYKRLYDLGSDRLGIIDSMLTSGDSPATVAEHVQQDWGQCKTVKLDTLRKQILRYKQDVLEPKLVLAAEAAVEKGTPMTEGMARMREQVDVMAKMNEALLMQHTRIMKAYTKELTKENGKMDPNINKELRPFTDMCRVLAGLQLETGVLRRVPKQVQGFFQQLDTNELQEFRMEMTQNDETLKSLGMIKDVLTEAAEEAMNGELVPVGPESPAISDSDVGDLESESD